MKKAILLLSILFTLGTQAQPPAHVSTFECWSNGLANFTADNLGVGVSTAHIYLVDINGDAITGPAAYSIYITSTASGIISFTVPVADSNRLKGWGIYVIWSDGGNSYTPITNKLCSSLPIKIYDFKTEDLGSEVNVFFKSADEIKMIKYIIEISLDGGKTWVEKLSIPVSKTSGGQYFYKFKK
jgi:hypothetical protein